jgi:RNA polymerase sigma-70 factor (ECF subfamily)
MSHDYRHLQSFLAHRSALIEYATPMVGDRALAEDVVQEAFLRLSGDRESGKSSSAQVRQPVGYLYTVVRNLALDHVRRRSIETRQRDDGAVDWRNPNSPRTPEEEATYDTELRQVAAALDGISERARIAVEMHRFGGYTLQQIAETLETSVPTVHRLVKDSLLKVVLALESDQ